MTEPFVEIEGEAPELRALRQRAARGEELTALERRRYAELVTGRLKELFDSARLAAAPLVAEVDQVGAAVKDLVVRLEALGEAEALSGIGVPIDTPAQLACDLTRAAELVMLYAGWDWEAPQLQAARQRVDELDATLWRHQERYHEYLAEVAAEEGS